MIYKYFNKTSAFKLPTTGWIHTEPGRGIAVVGWSGKEAVENGSLLKWKDIAFLFAQLLGGMTQVSKILYTHLSPSLLVNISIYIISI